MCKPVSIGALLDELVTGLGPVSETARLDAQVLLGSILQRGRAWVLAHPEASVEGGYLEQIRIAAGRLQAGEPLPYVLGAWEFFGLSFQVSPDVLIPRPETELLVEQALNYLIRQPKPARVLEVGTGSGCIAISLAKYGAVQVIATDISLPALRLARNNARQHGVQEHLTWIQSDLLSSIYGNFNLICANLPYIPRETCKKLKVTGREPWLAFDGGPDGLDLIRRLLWQSPARLLPGGQLLLEIEASQGRAAQASGQAAFPNAIVQVLPDLAGHERLLVIQT